MNKGRTSLAVVAACLAVTVSCASEDQAGPNAPSIHISIPSASGPALPMATPEEVGMSEETLASIQPAMLSAVEEGRLPGIVTMVA